MKFVRHSHLVGFLTLLFLGSCSSPESSATGVTREGRPDMESWTVTITFTDEGKIRAIVNADHLQKFNDRQFVQIDGNVRIDFFDEVEKHISLLTAEFAEIEEISNYMVAFENVVVVSDSGVNLYTDTLSMDHEAELIFTDDSVMVTTEEQDTLYGVGFESDLHMEQWTILKPSGVTARDAE